MKKMFTLVLSLVLILGFSTMTVFADEDLNSGFYDINADSSMTIVPKDESNGVITPTSVDLDEDQTDESLYENSVKMTVSYNGATEEKYYLVRLVDANTSDILYIDQKTAESNTVEFNVYPMIPSSTSDLNLIITSNDGKAPVSSTLSYYVASGSLGLTDADGNTSSSISAGEKIVLSYDLSACKEGDALKTVVVCDADGNETNQITATIKSSNNTIEVLAKSSCPGGLYTITATTNEGVTAVYSISVTAKTANITLPAGTTLKDDEKGEYINIAKGKYVQLKAVIDDGTSDTFTWTSDNPSIAKVDAKTGKVTAVAPGECTITAKATISEASSTIRVKVTSPITKLELFDDEGKALKTLNMAYGDSVDVYIKTTPTLSDYVAADFDVTKSGTDSDKITLTEGDPVDGYDFHYVVSAAGTVKSATINITDTLSKKKVSFKATAVKATTSIELGAKDATVTEIDNVKNIVVAAKKTAQLLATMEAGSGDVLTWTSDNPAVAKVDSKGKVTAVAPGDCTITAKSNLSEIKDTIKVKVTSPVTKLEIFDANGVALKTLSVAYGDSVDVYIKTTPTLSDYVAADFDVTKSGTDSDKITLTEGDPVDGYDFHYVVSAEGTVKSATINITDTLSKKKVSFKATAVKATTSIVLGAKDATVTEIDNVKNIVVAAKKTAQLLATMEAGSGDVLTWTSDNPAVAKVDAKTGKVTAVSAGECNITATSNLSDEKDTIHVKVTSPVTKLELFDDEGKALKTLSVAYGDEVDIFIKTTPTLSDYVAADFDVTKSGTDSDKITLTEGDPVDGYDFHYVVSAEGTVKSATINITDTLSKKKVSFKTTAVKATTSIELGAKDATVTEIDNVKNIVVAAKKTAQLLATMEAGSGDVLTWTSDNPAVAKVDSKGKVTAVSAGECNITATSNLSDEKDTIHVKVTSPVTKLNIVDANGTTLKTLTMDYADAIDIYVDTTPELGALVAANLTTSITGTGKEYLSVEEVDDKNGHDAHFVVTATGAVKGATVNITDTLSKKKASFKVTVVVAAKEITLTPPDDYTGIVFLKKKVALKYTTDPVAISEKLVWSVDDPKIASVSTKGEVTGKAVGTTTVRLKGAKTEATFEVTVKAVVTKLAPVSLDGKSATKLSLDKGDTTEIIVKTTPVLNDDLVYELTPVFDADDLNVTKGITDETGVHYIITAQDMAISSTKITFTDTLSKKTANVTVTIK